MLTISLWPSTSFKTVFHLFKASEAQTHGLDAPPLSSNWRSRCAREEDEVSFAHFYSLITFTGPQSHLCNHGDADKVTHDYSSMVPPDWTAPKSLARRIHQRSLCPCSTSICPSGWWKSISAALSLFFTSGLHGSFLLPIYLSSRDVPPISQTLTTSPSS